VWKLNFDTMTNVVDVYINYLRRKVDFGYDLALIRTIRGIGYQIGANGTAATRQRWSQEKKMAEGNCSLPPCVLRSTNSKR